MNVLFLFRNLKAIAAIAALAIGMSACAALPVSGSTSWQEEALLHDGSKIVVKRTVQRGGRHEVGQRPPIRHQSLVFSLPKTQATLVWEDSYSADLGTTSFNVKLVEVVDKTAYVLASPAGCLSYNKWGRPNPPYVIFKHNGTSWHRIALEELPVVIKKPNLNGSDPDVEVEQSGNRFITAEMVASLNAGYRQPEYRSILRSQIPNNERDCGEMVSNGKGRWVGMGWFKRQPSYQACVYYCDGEGFSAEFCPCKNIFKGE